MEEVGLRKDARNQWALLLSSILPQAFAPANSDLQRYGRSSMPLVRLLPGFERLDWMVFLSMVDTGIW
jgi:hypothetical protein